MKDLVSIITPTFNSEKFISETISSVLNQTYANWEMIIVDDCSSDKTLEIITKFANSDSRIKSFQLEKNFGAGIARNKALEFADGKYIAFLDADDLWKPEKLEKQIDFIKKYNLKFTFSYYNCVDENGKSLNKIIQAPVNLTYKQLFYCNFIGNLTGIYDASFFGKIPISSTRKRQDWILWLTILKQIKTAKPVPESLAFYRIRQDSISATKTSLLKHNFNIYRNFHKKNVLVSCFFMVGFLFSQLVIKPRFIINEI